MRLWIGTGASGGHLYPALAVARAAQKRGHTVRILLGGPQRVSLPMKDLPKIERVWAGPVKGMGPKAVWGLIRVLIGAFQATGKIRVYGGADVVLASGSYAAVPAILAARILRIPYALMEQNVLPGLAVRRFEAGAAMVFLAFQETQQYLKHPQTYWVGNPTLHVLKSFNLEELRAKWEVPQGYPIVLGIGGSQGSLHLAEVLLEVSRRLPKVFFIIQTGRSHALLIAQNPEKGENYRLIPFIREMTEVYTLADLVVTRAGGGAIAELTLFGKPAILIPFPGAAGHQEWNAKVLTEQGAAVMVRDSEWDSSTATSLISSLLTDPARLQQMAERARALAKPHAAEEIVQILEESIS